MDSICWPPVLDCRASLKVLYAYSAMSFSTKPEERKGEFQRVTRMRLSYQSFIRMDMRCTFRAIFSELDPGEQCYLKMRSIEGAHEDVRELMKVYARLQESGNIRAFLALMLTFGKGATLHRLATENV